MARGTIIERENAARGVSRVERRFSRIHPFTKGATMNSDLLKGKWNQFKGDLKKQWGTFTDDDLMTIEGDHDKLKGLLQERYADQKDEFTRWVFDWYRVEPSPDSAASAPKPAREKSRT